MDGILITRVDEGNHFHNIDPNLKLVLTLKRSKCVFTLPTVQCWGMLSMEMDSIPHVSKSEP